jgi:hypothetical protein
MNATYTTYCPSRPTNMTTTVEYDCRGGRTTKTFSDVFAARRFYSAKYKSGHNPKIVKNS